MQGTFRIRLFSSRFASLFFLCCFLITSLSHAIKPDVSFEVQKVGFNRLRLKAHEGYRQVFDETLSLFSPVCSENASCFVTSTDKGLLWRYQGKDHSYLSFSINNQGDIILERESQGTQYERKKSWGFKTSGQFINKTDSAFYNLTVNADEVHNHSVLKCFTGDFTSSYYFNQGIMHFGDLEPNVVSLAYLEYLPFIDPKAKPRSYSKGIIDDYGVILADQGLEIHSLTHIIHGLVEADSITLKEASLDIQNDLRVQQTIQGQAPRIEVASEAQAHIGVLDHRLQLQNWNNQGTVFLEKPSQVYAHQSMSNKVLMGIQDITLRSRKKPKSVGVVASEGTVKLWIDELLNDEMRKAVLKQAALISGRNKIILDILQHTDHYLNTITDHYTVDQYGRKSYSHRTETGYVFQHRSTEKTQKTFGEDDGKGLPKDFKQAQNYFINKDEIRAKVKAALKSRLKGMRSVSERANELQEGVLSLLGEIGFTMSEINDLFEDDLVQDLMMAFAMPQDHPSRFTYDPNTPGLKIYQDIISSAQRAGMEAYQWVRRNPEAFLDIVCLTARTNVLSTIPYAGRPLNFATNTFCTGQKIYKGTPKLQRFLNKRHDVQGPNKGRSETVGGLYNNSGKNNADKPSNLPTTGQKRNKEQPWTIREGQEYKNKIIGRGQSTGTEGHATASYRIGIKEAKKSEIKKVYLNRGVKRATGEPIKPNTRPDVTSVTKDGKVNQFEVPSKTDKREDLLNRMEKAREKFSPAKRGENQIVEIKKPETEGFNQQ